MDANNAKRISATKALSYAGLMTLLPAAHADIQAQTAYLNFSQKALSVSGNASYGALMLDRKDPTLIKGGMLRGGVAFEYGDVEELFDLYNELADKFEPVDPDKPPGPDGPDGPDIPDGGIDWDAIFKEYPELEGQLKAIQDQLIDTAALFALIATEGYAKAELGLELGLVIQDDIWGGSLLMGTNVKGYSKAVGIFEDIDFDIDQASEEIAKIPDFKETDPVQVLDLSGGITLYYEPATGKARVKIDNDSLLLVKTAVVNKINLAYSAKAYSNDNGALYWGMKPTLYNVGLTNVGVAIGDITNSEEIIQRIKTSDYEYSAGFDVDLGVTWAAKNYQVGASLLNAFESEYNFPELSRNIFKSQNVIQKLDYHRQFVLERQLRLDAAIFTEDRHWSLNMEVDANKVADPMRDNFQWLNVSGHYASDGWWLPSVRVGFSKNLAGSKLSYASAGITAFKFLDIDISSTLDTVRLKDQKFVRGLNVTLGVQFDY